MISFIYDGVDFSGLVTVHEITGRGTLPSKVDLVEIRGRDGVYAHNKRRTERTIEVSFSLISNTPGGLRAFTDVFNSLVDLKDTAPLVFSDEPTMTYYATTTGASGWTETRSFAQATLTFVCPDPYKYGPVSTASLSGTGSTIINVSGTAPTKPRFELAVASSATYAMVAKGTSQYMMVGREAAIEQEVFNPREVVLSNSGTTTSGWSTAATGEINGDITGTMTVNGNAFLSTNYGDGAMWHGPAIKYPLPVGVQDFTAEFGVDFGNTGAGTNLGRVEAYLLSSSGELLARIAIKDNFRDTVKTVAEAQAGGNEGHMLINSEGPDNGTSWNNFSGVMRISRSARTWEAYIAQVSPTTGAHGSRMTRKWTDVSNQSLDEVAQVVIHVGEYYNWVVVPKQHFTYVTVTKFTRPASDSQVPFAISTGDSLVFDHGTGEILKDGTDIRREKNFGGFPFELEPGNNVITLMPSGALTGSIEWRNAYL